MKKVPRRTQPDSYMPQWRALAGARGILSDGAKVWKENGYFFVGQTEEVRMRAANGHLQAAIGVRIYGKGANWPEALANAKTAYEARKAIQPKDNLPTV